MEDLGMSDDVVAATVSDMKILWKATDTGFEQTEWFGDIKVKHGAKFNEEIDYKFPLDGAEASKMVTTKIATGKYKQFCKNPDGSTTEWGLEFGDGSWCIVSFKLYLLQDNLLNLSFNISLLERQKS